MGRDANVCDGIIGLITGANGMRAALLKGADVSGSEGEFSFSLVGEIIPRLFRHGLSLAGEGPTIPRERW